MKIFLVRHGETIENKEGIVQGHLQGNLSDLGKEQARKLGARLKDFKFHTIYSSPLKRAVDTANEILKYHKDTPFCLIENLKEFGFGKHEGKRKTEIDFEKDSINFEGWNKFISRLNLVLHHLKDKHKGQSILLVVHGGVISAITKLLLKMDLKNKDEKIESNNASLFIFELKDDGSFLPLTMNCTKHLD